jgi:hypothetical protein
MKMITYLTDTHNELYEKYFLPSLPASIDLIVIKGEQYCKSGEYASEGWTEQIGEKLSSITRVLKGIRHNELFIVSDVDVQFFGDPVEDLVYQLGDRHIAFQRDDASPTSGKTRCTGFYIARNNSRTKALLHKSAMVIKSFGFEQKVVNHCVHQVNGLRTALLDERYFTHGLRQGLWDGKFEIDVPDNILVHHANWTKGIDNKLKLLRHVRGKYSENQNRKSAREKLNKGSAQPVSTPGA